MILTTALSQKKADDSSLKLIPMDQLEAGAKVLAGMLKDQMLWRSYSDRCHLRDTDCSRKQKRRNLRRKRLRNKHCMIFTSFMLNNTSRVAKDLMN
jgi:hypothetical protein